MKYLTVILYTLKHVFFYIVCDTSNTSQGTGITSITNHHKSALRVNLRHENDVNYEELVVDEKDENAVKNKTNITKIPLIEPVNSQMPIHEEETGEDFYMALNKIKFEDLIAMRNQIEHFIMNEIQKRINSNATNKRYDQHSHVQLEPNDIISEDTTKPLGHKF